MAYDAKTGSELWSFKRRIRKSAVEITSYAVNGKQYIVVPSGFGSLFRRFRIGAFPRLQESQREVAALIAFTGETDVTSSATVFF